jgi:hypothetical protein
MKRTSKCYFFCLYDKAIEPYIRIATGDYGEFVSGDI